MKTLGKKNLPSPKTFPQKERKKNENKYEQLKEQERKQDDAKHLPKQSRRFIRYRTNFTYQYRPSNQLCPVRCNTLLHHQVFLSDRDACVLRVRRRSRKNDLNMIQGGGDQSTWIKPVPFYALSLLPASLQMRHRTEPTFLLSEETDEELKTPPHAHGQERCTPAGPRPVPSYLKQLLPGQPTTAGS